MQGFRVWDKNTEQMYYMNLLLVQMESYIELYFIRK